jgi:hypothetical protein
MTTRRKRTPEEQAIVSRVVEMVDDELSGRAPTPAPRPDDRIVADGRQWVRVRAPRRWQPRHDGDVLVGQFLSRTTRPGDNGSTYAVVTIGVGEGAVTIAGVVISSLFDAAGDLEHGTPVRIVYKGELTSIGSGRKYKDFELWLDGKMFKNGGAR